MSHLLMGLVALIGGSVLQEGTVAITAPTNALPPQPTLDSAADQPAQVVFQYPTNGMVFSAPYTGTVFLSDYGQVGRLDCFVNGALKGTTSNPFLSMTLSIWQPAITPSPPLPQIVKEPRRPIRSRSRLLTTFLQQSPSSAPPTTRSSPPVPRLRSKSARRTATARSSGSSFISNRFVELRPYTLPFARPLT